MVAVAVVGSGVAAITAVRTLCTSSLENNLPVQVTWFTARRKMGSTQSSLSNSPMARPKPGDPFFDYGCQYMSPVSTVFRNELERWQELGLVGNQFEVSVLNAKDVHPKMTKLESPGWVGNGGMGPMLEKLTIQTREEFAGQGLEHVSGFPEVERQVTSTHRDENTQKWFLNTKRQACEFGPFDYVIGCFGHPKRTDPFLKPGGDAAKPMMEFLKGVKYNQFFALQIILEKGLDSEEIKNLSGCHILNHDVISFVADNSKKPHQIEVQDGVRENGQKPHITIISTANFAKQNQKANRKMVQDRIMESFANLIAKETTRQGLESKFQPKIHRLNFWGDGRCVKVVDGTDFLFDTSVNLGWCGDFCVGPSVDSAAISGASVAEFCINDIEQSLNGQDSKGESRLTKWKAVDSDITVDIGTFSHLSPYKEQISKINLANKGKLGGQQRRRKKK